jgi:hypothetical protein
MKRKRYPKLPIAAGKARQQLSMAIMLEDHDLASWIDRAVKTGQVTGRPGAIRDLKHRLDEVMEPHRPS